MIEKALKKARRYEESRGNERILELERQCESLRTELEAARAEAEENGTLLNKYLLALRNEQDKLATLTAERDEMNDRDNLLATYCERMGNCDGCIVARECTEMYEKRKAQAALGGKE